MAISIGDKLRLVCWRCGMWEESEFIAAMEDRRIEEHGDAAARDADALGQARTRWFYGGGIQEHNRNTLFYILNERGRALDPPLGDIAQLLKVSATVEEFINRCGLRYPEVKDILTDEARDEWDKRYPGMHFMKLLSNHEEDPVGRKILDRMPGTYYMYRRHSVLPGVLREILVVTKRHYNFCEGQYYQFTRTGRGYNIIDFNTFFAGFYLLSFGAHNDAERGRTEILEVKILIQHLITESRTIHCTPYFIGLLTGIFDAHQMLLAERIFVERISDNTTWDPHLKPVQLLPDGPSADVIDHRRVRNIVDNSLDGQVLTARPSRLEETLI